MMDFSVVGTQIKQQPKRKSPSPIKDNKEEQIKVW